MDTIYIEYILMCMCVREREMLPKMLKINFYFYFIFIRFVGLVRSKTPKVTVYSEMAKCMLMENSHPADFEAAFYEGGSLVLSMSCV